MAELKDMPEVRVAHSVLVEWGSRWLGTAGSRRGDGTTAAKARNRFDKKQGMEFDDAFGASLAAMLGGIPVVKPDANA